MSDSFSKKKEVALEKALAPCTEEQLEEFRSFGPGPRTVLPCKVCGSEPVFGIRVDEDGDLPTTLIVGCEKCREYVEFDDSYTRPAVMLEWNRANKPDLTTNAAR
jgi:hypothetical protein